MTCKPCADSMCFAIVLLQKGKGRGHGAVKAMGQGQILLWGEADLASLSVGYLPNYFKILLELFCVCMRHLEEV